MEFLSPGHNSSILEHFLARTEELFGLQRICFFTMNFNTPFTDYFKINPSLIGRSQNVKSTI